MNNPNEVGGIDKRESTTPKGLNVNNPQEVGGVDIVVINNPEGVECEFLINTKSFKLVE